MCTANLKTNKSMETKTEIDGETKPAACVFVFVCAHLVDRQRQRE